jgi:hypothetical protein
MMENPAFQPDTTAPASGATTGTVRPIDENLNTTTPAQEPAMPSRRRGRFLAKPWQKVVAGLLVVLLLLGSVAAAMGFYTLAVVNQLKAQVDETEVSARAAYDAFKMQNLPTADAELKNVQTKLGDVRQTYNKLGFYRFVPVASMYYNDGVHGLNAADAGVRAGIKSLEGITPYADVLGFAGEGTFTGGTIEDRLNLLLQTLSKITPLVDEITAEVKTVDAELAQINPNRYPENFRGTNIRSLLSGAQLFSKGALTALTDYRPILEQLPAMAGSGQARKYLILFCNDGEQRPACGGFMTAYAIIKVENGKIQPEKSDDIYELDKKFTKNLPIPPALGRYLTTEKRWNLRDMNTSPDFKESMNVFLEHYKGIKGEDQSIDGVIAINTHVLVDLIKALGPVNVPGYGTFTAENDPRCDCPNIIYEMSNIITRPTPYIRTDRKGMIGPLMREILTKFYTAPKQQWPAVFEAALGKFEDRGQGGWIGGRHIQAYFYDEKFQQAAETINVAGRMTPVENSDFLGIVNANLGGAKSNFFITHSVTQEVSAPENGVITKSIEITYKNSRHGDNCNLEAGLLCLNSTNRDWTRIYLPAGAKLVEANGFREAPKEYEENGFNVIDGFFLLEANSQAKLRLTYTVPYADTETYRLKLWKQGGTEPVTNVVTVNGEEHEVIVDRDRSVEVTF